MKITIDMPAEDFRKAMLAFGSIKASDTKALENVSHLHALFQKLSEQVVSLASPDLVKEIFHAGGHVEGWSLDLERSGCLMLTSEDYGGVVLYATPNWTGPDTLSFQLDLHGEDVEGWDIPVKWTGRTHSDIYLWRREVSALINESLGEMLGF